MDDIYNNILEHIADGIRYARAKQIKENTIILDKGIAIVNDLYFVENSAILHSKPMIMGLEVKYQTNLRNDFGCNFIIGTKANEEEKPKTLSDYTIEELLDEIKKRAIL